MTGDKAALRRELLAKREALPCRKALDRAMEEQVRALDAYREARALLLYLSKGSEPDTWGLLDRALAEGRPVYAPRCLDGRGNMAFYRVPSREGLVLGRFGLWEPDPARCPPWEGGAGALCLVPGIAFDREGFRLGYGMGYYDRFLAGFSGSSLGLCYEGLVQDRLPRGVYDRKVGRLVTESGAAPTGKEGRL